MSEVIIKLAKQAGMIRNEELFDRMEAIGGRGVIANLTELTEFARAVGQVARADERRKYEGPNETPSADDGERTGDT
jgi:hypothetical protein